MAKAVKATVFYSWQSDTPGATNRNFILKALEDAAKEIAGDDSIDVEPVVDRDTQNVAGSPDIGNTILGKIRGADVVVADVTIINPGLAAGRPTPNPNVLVEVGYALAVHSEARLILVNNLAFGRPEDLPFDLRQKRVLTYTAALGASERAVERHALQSALKIAVGAVLAQHGVADRSEYPCRFSMTYRVETQSQHLHEYVLQIKLENVGAKRITDWHVDVEIPTPLLKKASSHEGYVRERSDKHVTLIRFTHDSDNAPIFPGDSRLMQLSYHMNRELFERSSRLFGEVITARAYVQGVMAAEINKAVGEMQNF